ncbi:reverse transcriptase domain-containing protein [Tanacetum coccineum]
MPSHVGSYDRKGDPDNFLHLFEGRSRIRHKSVSGAETSNRRSCQIRTTSTFGERSKEGKGKSFKHSIGRMEEGRQKYKTSRSSIPYDKKKMVPQKESQRKSLPIREDHIPLVSGNNNSSDPVTIKAKISRRQVLKSRLKDPPRQFFRRTLLASQRSSSGNYDKGKFFRKNGVVSTIHRAIKFHTPEGVGTILSTYETDKTREVQKKLKEASQEITKETLSCMSAEEEIVINDKYPDQIVIIERQLPTGFKKKLHDLLKLNVDIFAWTYADMTGIPRTIMVGGKPFITEHKLNELKHMEARKQKKRGLAPERNEALYKEVEELTKVNILREVKYRTWVSNPVMIRKGNEKWKLCVDFTDINKSCPKDCYPLPTNDQKAESLTKFRLKCFLDAYKGYHQIPMAEGDKEKTAFFIREGVFCYRRLPFGLKNARATYQRLVDTVFGNQIGQNLKVHVDDMVKAISDLKPPKMVKEIQSLNEKLAALSRFLPKGTDKALLFLKVLKNYTSMKIVQWTQEAEESFQKMNKHYLWSQPQLKAKPWDRSGILTDKPIKQILARPEKSGRIAKWTIELGEHDIEFKGRNSIKGHVLADFLAETPTTKSKETQKARNEGLDPENTWKLYTDGASSSDGCRAGLILVNLEGREYTYALMFEFETTSSEAEYEVLLAGLRIAEEMKIEDLDIFVDFQLVANQVKRLFEARHPVIKAILRENKKDTQKFQELLDGTWKVVTNIIKKEGENGMAPIREHLLFGNLPNHSQKARKIRIKAPQYRMIDNDLYRKSYLSPWLRCVGPTQAKSIIEKIHQDTDIKMSNMPNILIDAEEAKAGNDIYNASMAFLPMGNRHCETTATHTRRCKVHGRSHRLLHKMGRSKTTSIHDRKTHGEVCMGAYHVHIWTTPKSSNGETPFSLVYPIKISVEAQRIKEFKARKNEKKCREDLDILKERREIASIREAYYKQKLERYCNKRV